jgi:hypothetical protein
MSAWVESASQNFVARHEERDDDDVGAVLDLLEDTRDRLGSLFPAVPPGEVTVVLHSSRVELDLAQPLLPVVRRLTTPAAQRYVCGWAGRSALHTLTPRLLAERAAKVEGSREMLLLTPAALYAQLVVAECNRLLPPPWSPRSTVRASRWAWLVAGAGQWFSGQTAHAGPAIARRLREGEQPDFPPSLRDAALLGGTVIDLVARESGVEQAVNLVCALPPGGAREALVSVFGGRAMVHSEGTWRAHLARMAGR